MPASPLVLTAVAVVTAVGAGAQEVAFARDVLPILSDRCFACHGPDAAARKAKLRLDERAGAFADRGGYAAVVPGDPAASELFRRITSADPEHVMPPPDARLALTEAEIATVRRWIEGGAGWQDHWAFVVPTEPAVPAVRDPAWARSELDRFVLARLDARDRRPSAAADPATLLRRVTLDLTGLPPTPAELEAFLADPSDAAYERIVDRLLASPRYGERMAWPWLEAARYADTDGFQADPTRTMWPWRDWLIGALNDNLPFDRFTIEALAGDLLPDATPEQVLASGFHRNHAHNGEGGRIAEETRVENVFDRTETTATVWMGMTFECARCHDHKYDPVTQRDYYRLFAFFDQTSENGAGASGRVPPTLRYLAAESRRRIAELQQQVGTAQQRMRAPDPGLDAAQAEWERERAAGLARADRPAEFGVWARLGPLPPRDGDAASLFATAFGPELAAGVDRDRTDGASALAWAQVPELRDGQPFALSDAVGATYLHRTVAADSPRELVLSLGSDDAIRVWCNGVELLANNVRRGVAPDQERVRVALRAGSNDLLLKIVNTGGAAGVYFRVAEELVDGLPAAVVAALRIPAAERDPAAAQLLRAHYRAEHSPTWRGLAAEVAGATAERERLENDAPEVMVMDQLPADRRRETRVLERGAYDQQHEVVTAAVPAWLPALPAQAPPDRLALARWLVSGEHPLTARVAVNRAWQLFFGRGLVETSEDFGRQGSRPTHPELLDWLARRFVESGWDVKALHRRIVTSATYRQSSHAAPDAYADDPDNAELARASRLRWPAWMLRDQALQLSGRLVERLGGPPVRPYQPAGVWDEATFDTIRYERDRGDALYRRSVYVFWRRIVGPTFFFDTMPRQTCVVGRSETNSPLHALTTWNETAFVEAARGFAERAWREGGETVESRIAWAFRAATARLPTEPELARLVARFAQSRAHFAADPSAAAALLQVGDATADPSMPAGELAAYTVVTSILLNLDEVLTRS